MFGSFFVRMVCSAVTNPAQTHTLQVPLFTTKPYQAQIAKSMNKSKSHTDRCTVSSKSVIASLNFPISVAYYVVLERVCILFQLCLVFWNCWGPPVNPTLQMLRPNNYRYHVHTHVCLLHAHVYVYMWVHYMWMSAVPCFLFLAQGFHNFLMRFWF